MDFRQKIAIERKNKQRFLDLLPSLNDNSGIYFLTREENGFKYAYIGQAKHILTRLAQHLEGYQHIDLSLKKHGLYSTENPVGWNVGFIQCEESQLDDYEQRYILHYANAGYQLRNKTAGGQSSGKFEIAETRQKKGYRDGLIQGYANAKKEIAKLFEKHLTYSINGEPNKIKEKALHKFEIFLEVDNDLKERPNE